MSALNQAGEASYEIAAASAADVGDILRLIRALAEYEKLIDQVVATEAALHEALFESKPQAQALVARSAGGVVGFALYFQNYSTFRARSGIYLEDLFVEPAHRSRGIGRALLRQLAAIAVERGCARFEWAVLDWNQPAIDFYKSLGATPLDDWTVYRLTGAALQALAQEPT
jgi:GNAT superfamily N-acetyltransferase